MIALGQQPETAAASSEYLRAISWGLLPALWLMANRGFLEGNSNTLPIMVISILGIGANIGLNYVLMFGKFGCPALGLVGTGYASSIVYTCGCLLLMAYTIWQYDGLDILNRLKKPQLDSLRELLVVGGPIGMSLGFEAGMFSAAAVAMGALSSVELAAHQIAVQTASISFMIPLGVAIATSVRVGHAVGTGDLVSARLAGHVGMMALSLIHI